MESKKPVSKKTIKKSVKQSKKPAKKPVKKVKRVKKTVKNSIDPALTAQVRQWAFTAYKHIEFDFYDNLYKVMESQIRYLVVGKETCPTTGRPHIQGFIHFRDTRRKKPVQEFLDDDVLHVEPAYKEDIANKIYCCKQKDFKEYGTLQTKQGKRNDITGAVSKYNSLVEFIRNEPDLYIRYRAGIEGYYRSTVGVHYVVDGHRPVVVWLYGETGKGKSYPVNEYIRSRANDGYTAWRRPLGASAWFDGYVNQDIAFLDEVRSSTYNFVDLLQMLDYNAPQVQIKYGFTSFRPKIIFITSNQHPRKVFEYISDENLDQLIRRCDYVVEVTKFDPQMLFKEL